MAVGVSDNPKNVILPIAMRFGSLFNFVVTWFNFFVSEKLFI